MVKRKTYQTSEHSDAEPGNTWTSNAEKKENTPRAKEAVYVGFVPNMSAWAFWIPEDKKIMTTNQAQFDEHEFPVRKRKMVEQHLSNNFTDICSNKLPMSNRFHTTSCTSVIILKSIMTR
jgi:hypothetical protein